MSGQALARSLRRRIAQAGPLTVADFMVAALSDPRHGYYRRATPLGAAGDFVTAPEISQLFGELIGAWLAERWIALGSPPRLRLVELGPGNGTLLADALRATRGVAGFHATLDIHLVEIHAGLRARQAAALAGLSPSWHERFDGVPDGVPLLLVANEFFDALPIRQFVRRPWGWAERMIGAGAGDLGFAWATAPGPSPLAALLAEDVREAGRAGDIVELSPVATRLAADIAARLSRDRGAALIVDYGYDRGSNGDTWQALRRHRKTDPFDDVGDGDLTAHVDFAALGRAARAGRVEIDGPVGQGDFLRALGIEARRDALKRRATATQAQTLDAACRRLIEPAQMGTLFRVLALRDGALPLAAGFDVGGALPSPGDNDGPSP